MLTLTLYNRQAIWIFSILLTGIGGAIMLGYNLRAVGKNKVVAPLIILTVIGNAMIRQIVKTSFPGSATELFIPNLICGLILAFPVWNNYLSEFMSYSNKKIWWPLIVVVVLYGGFYLLNILVGKPSQIT